ncbi:MAG TPA: sigma-70 family RNA polymerase sigma factor [Candidatus Polarisedimenticolia bacterium]|nr:sigma-70 family RNA polymerase sigma factor [Candidatus Polarisedimenticolia bacterium]
MMPREDDDRDLMRRLQRGDERALTRLILRHSGRMLAVASRLLGSRADAEDAVQRAFIRCHAHARFYRSEWTVTTWLYRILTNACVDEIRRRRARPEEPLPERAPALGARTGPQIEARLDLERGLAKVPTEARALLVLRYVEGLSYGELARVRGISVNTVKSQLKRGRKILKAALAERPRAMGGRR